jgi:diguanylate cyclase (GGDEF)-like protein
MAAGMPAHRSGTGREQDALLDPRAILTSIGVLVYNWDLASDRIEWGRNAAEVLGLGDMAGWSSGREFSALVEPDAGPTLHEAIQNAKETDSGSGVPYSLRYTVRPKPDRVVAVEDSGRWYADANGKPAVVHGMMKVQRPGAETGAAVSGSRERSGFLARIGSEVIETARSKNTLTIVVAAIDNLPALNDEIGFEAADAVIEEVFRRLCSTMRRRDLFARYSGNRFALALRSCPPDQIHVAVDRLIDAVTFEPITTTKGPVSARLVFGAATAPQHATEAAALLRCAEQSLGAAKRGARTPLVLYDPKTMRGERRRGPVARAADVLNLLNQRRITIACQPVVEATSREVAFSEALLRIEGEDGRIVIAADVIPAVERIGLVPLVDIRILEIAASYLASKPDERLSINVSPLTLESSDWLPALSANLGAYPGIADRLIVEITETVAINDPDTARKRLDAMKALGVALAIDDFGAGHTSFRHLRHFPIDLIKIDGAFAQNLARSSDDCFFVRTLIDLAHHLCITAVAEWVEDEAAAKLLTGWGIDYLQGDHCGKPVLITRPDRNPLSLRA